ncbi:hypothetical protein HPB51_007364 [Rhipicephalus microplus]|uniref:Nose resistant-to-fluoxetine protein N-terminal domain-containing protein n=1 Tax=Rhipicephalus microplus TaxID=6941 RepID=A0A9J6EFE2_RHIMP|nr:hypothetical protein HPB51_007364 [Rhipicephalus microplus]
MSRADLGAFDECLETVLFDDYGEERSRGQYCNLQVYPHHKTDLDDLFSSAMQYTHPRIPKFRESIYELKLPLLRMGVCMLNNCNEGELQELIRAEALPMTHDHDEHSHILILSALSRTTSRCGKDSTNPTTKM